jgi:hypothetical protein
MSGMWSWMSATRSLASVMMGTCKSTRRNPVPSSSGDGKRLFCFLPFDGLPLKETVHRHDAAALAISIPERR